MTNVSLGIMAYNEEANIGRLLKAVLKQKIEHALLNEVIVVVSGSTDKTEEITRIFGKKDNRVKIIVQQEREGKASAINLFLAEAKGEILILESADTLPAEGAFNKLIIPFENIRIGMTGAHPIPVNSKNNFVGFAVHLMWSLHHEIAILTPKLGELVAFRSFVRNIPFDTPVDEASIEAIVLKSGYRLQYVPDAVVFNKGPENIKDFIKQRRRIAAGHKQLIIRYAYKVSTHGTLNIFRILLANHSWKFRETIWTLGAMGLEMVSRLLGSYDVYICKKEHFIWEIVSSTKKLELDVKDNL